MIWAEARDIYTEQGDEALWLTQEERKVQVKVNERSYRSTPLGEAILEWAAERTRFKTGDIIMASGSHPLLGEYNPDRITSEAKEVLRYNGYEYKKQAYRTAQGERKGGVYCWANPNHWYEQQSDQEKKESEAMPFHGALVLSGSGHRSHRT
jgi:hypothetical protein